MERKEIVALLTGYRETRARMAYLREEIVRLKRQAERAQQPQALIALNALCARQDGPRASTPGDPAARLACAAADGSARLNPYHAALEEAREEYERAARACRLVEAWLDGLPARERWVVERHALERLPMADLPALYEAQHERSYCLDTLKSLYRKALAAIGRMTA
ncbi:MAG TPA: hypothetical protein IAC36_06105 [Candidatus Aphodomonas merdavium]|nr:hypothetical protein [Candidatus Aphodomonas merdavium]